MLAMSGLFFCLVSGVCIVLFLCLWLSVPVQSIAWKDSSIRNDLLCVKGDDRPYTLTHVYPVLRRNGAVVTAIMTPSQTADTYGTLHSQVSRTLLPLSQSSGII